jgi:signal transduction histidine kinase
VPGTTIKRMRRRTRAGAFFAAIVLAVGAVGACLAASQLNETATATAGQIMDRRTATVEQAVSSEVNRYVDLAQAVAAAVRSQPDLTAAQFDTITEALPQQRLAGVAAMSFVVATTDENVATTQTYWQAHGAEGLKLQPVGTGREHLFSVLSRTLAPSSVSGRGLDISQRSKPAAAFETARATGQPAISQPYLLLRDQKLPADQRKLSFAVAVPVYGPVGAGAPEVFRGWVGMGLRGQNFIGATLHRVAEGTLDVALLAVDGQSRVTVAELRQSHRFDRLRRETHVTVADQYWTLRTSTDPELLLGEGARLAEGAATAILVLSVLLAMLVFVLATSRARAQAQVAIATAELRVTEQEARRQAGLLTAIMASISDGGGVVNERGEFLLHNPEAKRLLGIDVDVSGPERWTAHYGIFLPDGVTPFPAEELPLVQALHGVQADGVEMVIRNESRPQGVTLSVSARPLDPSAGQRGAVAVFHDITERKRAEAELRELDRLKTEFVATVSHELRTPLTSIRGFAELLLDGDVGELTPALERAIRVIDQNSGRLLSLIEDLLTFSRIEAGKFVLAREHVDLGQILERSCQAIRPSVDSADLTLVWDAPETPVYLDADPGQMERVLLNVLSNAVKFTPAGGTVTLRTSQTDDEVVVSVTDTGVGVPVDEQKHLFTRFFRASTAHENAIQGTGLGLSIAKAVVEAHGGWIRLESQPGAGTTVTFGLPRPTAD